MLALTLFTKKTITSNLIKSLESSGTVTLILFEPGSSQSGIAEILADYNALYPGSPPELLTWVEGNVEDADSIQEKYQRLLATGSIRFVNAHGKLSSG